MRLNPAACRQATAARSPEDCSRRPLSEKQSLRVLFSRATKPACGIQRLDAQRGHELVRADEPACRHLAAPARFTRPSLLPSKNDASDWLSDAVRNAPERVIPQTRPRARP